MKYSTFLAVFLALAGVEAFAPQSPKASTKPAFDLKNAAAGAFAALVIGSSVLTAPVPASAVDVQPFTFTSTTVVAEKLVKEGMYRDYEVDVVQQVDDARSTFKSASETKGKKGKYTAILAILVVGSFIVPMAQYFWYVRDDDSTDKFFGAKDIPEPPPKKKGWF